ncbi:unnamed protein product [Mycena citricolor]|uniref:Uncharacterized protein n=1 Tax=Mycena citricolor TaxID=2018698 RepID=A0AAD2K7J8_9AGAR|nr:unnamed protein product [Mycena citricolor]
MGIDDTTRAVGRARAWELVASCERLGIWFHGELWGTGQPDAEATERALWSIGHEADGGTEALGCEVVWPIGVGD